MGLNAYNYIAYIYVGLPDVHQNIVKQSLEICRATVHTLGGSYIRILAYFWYGKSSRLVRIK